MLALDCILNLRIVLDKYFVMYISATAALYIILKCNFFEWQPLGFFVKIISIPDEQLFSETYVGCNASYFV